MTRFTHKHTKPGIKFIRHHSGTPTIGATLRGFDHSQKIIIQPSRCICALVSVLWYELSSSVPLLLHDEKLLTSLPINNVLVDVVCSRIIYTCIELDTWFL